MKYETIQEFLDAVKVQYEDYDLTDRWVVGGQSGGSCWDEGESTHYALSTDDEPELEVFDEILEMAIPDLTFREYRAVMKQDVITYRRDSQNEYYGNWTEYMVRTIDLDKLWRALVDIQAEREVANERKRAGLD